jgi:hypothetical protein
MAAVETHRRRGSDAVLIEYLARGRSLAEATEAAGMSERTGRRRRREPEIQAAIEERSQQIASLTSARLSALGLRAVEVLEGLLDDDKPDRIRQRAVEFGIQMRSGEELERRLRVLEDAALEHDVIAVRLAELLPQAEAQEGVHR